MGNIMSSLIPSGSASGTGSMTLAAPVTNSNQIITLPDATGTVALTSGSAISATTLSIGGTALGAGNSSIMKNRIINGAMVIDQRNAGASVTNAVSTSQYCLDRWNMSSSVASKYTVQQNAGSVTPPVGFTNYLGVTSLSAYAVGATDYFRISQAVEGFNFADLGFGTANAKTVTVSFWVRSSLTGTFGGHLINETGTRDYPFTYTISAANTWEQKSVTIAGDTTGTWVGATNVTGVLLGFSLGYGSSLSGTANVWNAGTASMPTGATSVVGTSGATFYITGVQLEVGSSATGYEYVNYQTSLANCQRYAYSTVTLVPPASGASLPQQLPVTMRTTPTASGGASGYTLSNASSTSFVHYQTSPASQTILFSAEL